MFISGKPAGDLILFSAELIPDGWSGWGDLQVKHEAPKARLPTALKHQEPLKVQPYCIDWFVLIKLKIGR